MTTLQENDAESSVTDVTLVSAISETLRSFWLRLRNIWKNGLVRDEKLFRVVRLKEKLVDNEKELYLLAIRNLESERNWLRDELEKAHARLSKVEDRYIFGESDKRIESSGDAQPIRPMTRHEAIRRVHEFERKRSNARENPVAPEGAEDANQISKTIQADASRSGGEAEGRGRAI